MSKAIIHSDHHKDNQFLASRHRSGENLIILHKQNEMTVGPI